MEGDEIWNDIPGCDGQYQVSNMGRVRRIITPIMSNHYLSVSIFKDGRYYPYKIHRLVMLAFEGECPKGIVVNHKNGIKTDNRLVNLEYCTHLENMRHARHVIKSWGEPKPQPPNSGYGKLSADAVREIRQQVASGLKTQKELSILHNVHEGTISRVINGRAWRNVK